MPKISASKFRCFDSIRDVEIRPITILVGENSAGKSSFLALTRFALESVSTSQPPSLNKEPFFLGAFKQIAFAPGGRGGRSNTFSISVEDRFRLRQRNQLMVGNKTRRIIEAKFTLTFSEERSEAFLSEFHFESEIGNFKMVRINDSFQIKVNNESMSVSEEINDAFSSMRKTNLIGSEIIVLHSLARNAFFNRINNKNTISFFNSPEFQLVDEVTSAALDIVMDNQISVFASGPYRSAPERTYNPTASTAQPDGSHAFQEMARIKRTSYKEWVTLKNRLDEFGDASGMYKSIDIRLFGADESDPYQVIVKNGAMPVNIKDIGYGVSQVLPLVFDIEYSKSNVFLLQQPEVHLHPQAQAALGSQLAQIASARKTVVLETHSDYLIDGIRWAAHQGTIKATDIGIYYFHKAGPRTTIEELELDQRGGIKKLPAHYRDFFHAHEMSMIRV